MMGGETNASVLGITSLNGGISGSSNVNFFGGDFLLEGRRSDGMGIGDGGGVEGALASSIAFVDSGFSFI